MKERVRSFLACRRVRHESHCVLLRAVCGNYAERNSISALMAKERAGAGSDTLFTEHPQLLLRRGEQAEHAADSLQLGRGVVAEHPCKRSVGGEESAIPLKEAKTHGRSIRERAEPRFRFAERVFNSAARYHRLLEIHDLFAETGDLVDEVLFGPVVVSHRQL
jgi:hypothetical protein